MDNDRMTRMQSTSAGREILPQQLRDSMPTTSAVGALKRMTPAQFLSLHNTDVGAHLVRRGDSPGSLALNRSIPTLAQVVAEYGEQVALVWLDAQLDAIDRMTSQKSMGEQALREVSRHIMAAYGNMNVGNLLQFFAQYKLGDFAKDVEHIAGAQKIMVALARYAKVRDADMSRVISNYEREQAWLRRLEWEKRAISYNDYKNETRNKI